MSVTVAFKNKMAKFTVIFSFMPRYYLVIVISMIKSTLTCHQRKNYCCHHFFFRKSLYRIKKYLNYRFFYFRFYEDLCIIFQNMVNCTDFIPFHFNLQILTIILIISKSCFFQFHNLDKDLKIWWLYLFFLLEPF